MSPRTRRPPGTTLENLALACFGVACLAAVVATPAAAVDDARPEFAIERVVVDGVDRLPPEIVVSESLIEPGRSYDESELRAAALRVQRLPFVLSAQVSLARGSERGLYELHIEVEETRRFFFGGEARHVEYGRPLGLEAVRAERDHASFRGVAGMRLFVGRYGQAHVAAGEGDGVEIGYTRYRLFGHPALASFAYSAGFCCETVVPPLGLDPTLAAWSEGERQEAFEVVLGLPLSAELAVRLEAGSERSTSGSRRRVLDTGSGVPVSLGDHSDLEQSRVEAALVFDTTDDPLFPSSGVALAFSVDLRRLDARLLDARDELGFPGAVGSRLARVALTASRHWSPWSRQSLSLSGRLSAGVSRVEGLPLAEDASGPTGETDTFDVYDASLVLRHRVRLLAPRASRGWGDLRWQTGLELGVEGTRPAPELAGNPLRRWSLETGLVLRNPWGVFRVTFAFFDLGGTD